MGYPRFPKKEHRSVQESLWISNPATLQNKTCSTQKTTYVNTNKICFMQWGMHILVQQETKQPLKKHMAHLRKVKSLHQDSAVYPQLKDKGRSLLDINVKMDREDRGVKAFHIKEQKSSLIRADQWHCYYPSTMLSFLPLWSPWPTIRHQRYSGDARRMLHHITSPVSLPKCYACALQRLQLMAN